MAKVIIYGSYGYTGQLIVDALGRHPAGICLSGRNESKLKEQSIATGLPYKAVELSDTAKLDNLLREAVVVIHCAGPFKYTAQRMAEACLRTGTHYLDITGEYQVFETLRKFHEQAIQKKIMVMPGAGFDVVPSDCLANYLASKMPDAEKLTLAFTSSGGGMSRGTSKTMIEGLKDGHACRVQGNIIRKGLGLDVREINYGPFVRSSAGISWGDISTAFFSTGIPNITVYTAAKKPQITRMRRLWRFRSIMTSAPVRNWMKKQVDRQPPGPSKDHLENGKSFLYGEVMDKSGRKCEARLTTSNGYRLTSMCVAHICNCVLAGNFKPGFQTPASAYGWHLITEVTGHQISED